MPETAPHEGGRPPVQIENVETVLLSDLLARVQGAHDQGLRFVTATCLDAGEDYEIYYHFAEGADLSHLHVRVKKGTRVPSISSIYMCAFLVENEIKELFGVPIEDIVIDYRGHLLLTDGGPVTPMLKQQAPQAS